MRGIFDPGGIATYIRDISAAQLARGHEVVWYDVRPQPPAPQNGNSAAQNAAQPSMHRLANEEELFDTARRQGVDIVHLHCTLASAAKPSLPAIRTVHNHHPYCPSSTRYLERIQTTCDCRPGLASCLRGHLLYHCGSVRPFKILESFQNTRQDKRFLRHVPAVCISNYVKQQMLQVGYAEEHLHLLHYAAPAPTSAEPTLPPRENPPRFVFLGRLTPHKGVAPLLQALQRAKTPAHLDIAGTGPLEADLARQVEALGLKDRVRFHGWLGPQQTENLLRGARALVFPSVWHEPAGLVTLEASLLGRAVIGTQVGGLPEYAIEGQNALIVPPGDIAALSVALDRLSDDWEFARRLGEQGRQLVAERFTMERHYTRLHQLYAQYGAQNLAGSERAA